MVCYYGCDGMGGYARDAVCCLEFGHVIEVYGFSPETKTDVILSSFKEFKWEWRLCDGVQCGLVDIELHGGIEGSKLKLDRQADR